MRIQSTWMIADLSLCTSLCAAGAGQASAWVSLHLCWVPWILLFLPEFIWFLFTGSIWKRVQISLRIEPRTFSKILKSFCLRGITISRRTQHLTKYVSGHLGEFSHNNSQALLCTFFLEISKVYFSLKKCQCSSCHRAEHIIIGTALAVRMYFGESRY